MENNNSEPTRGITLHIECTSDFGMQEAATVQQQAMLKLQQPVLMTLEELVSFFPALQQGRFLLHTVEEKEDYPLQIRINGPY